MCFCRLFFYICAAAPLPCARFLPTIVFSLSFFFSCLQISEAHYDILEEPTEDEEDMLDEATCLSATSRLGCQIILSKELEGMEITLPAYSRNFAVDGFIPEPH